MIQKGLFDTKSNYLVASHKDVEGDFERRVMRRFCSYFMGHMSINSIKCGQCVR